MPLPTLLRREDGQDLVEYSLLLAFVVVTSAALFLYNSDAVAGIWTVTSNSLSAADSMAK
ncbi:MAG: Flp family type IVb pilin [Acidobacteriota bacterium]